MEINKNKLNNMETEQEEKEQKQQSVVDPILQMKPISKDRLPK